ncbi:hypothetical protein EJB05_51818, partial [Eragrostis curvula]
MLASALVARRRRLHCSGSDTAAGRPAFSVPPARAACTSARRREERQLGAATAAPCRFRLPGRYLSIHLDVLGQEGAAPSPETSAVIICAVCLEELRGEAAALPCSHAYHAGCVRPWLAVHRACPCCRATAPALPEDY